jgi:hypothetical protein
MAGEATKQAESQETRHVADDLVLQEGLPMKEVERRIGVAVASAGLRHRVIAFYLRDVHERGLHQLAGYRTVVNYAVARFGISRREARELFAAGMALAGLPAIDESFRAAQLCWSKVRELVKVAVGQHDAAWLERAQSVRIDECPRGPPGAEGRSPAQPRRPQGAAGDPLVAQGVHAAGRLRQVGACVREGRDRVRWVG